MLGQLGEAKDWMPAVSLVPVPMVAWSWVPIWGLNVSLSTQGR